MHVLGRRPRSQGSGVTVVVDSKPGNRVRLAVRERAAVGSQGARTVRWSIWVLKIASCRPVPWMHAYLPGVACFSMQETCPNGVQVGVPSRLSRPMLILHWWCCRRWLPQQRGFLASCEAQGPTWRRHATGYKWCVTAVTGTFQDKSWIVYTLFA